METRGQGAILQGGKAVAVSYQFSIEQGKGSYSQREPERERKVWLTASHPAELQTESGESIRIKITEVHTQPWGDGTFDILES
jgi:hypothetical protein